MAKCNNYLQSRVCYKQLYKLLSHFSLIHSYRFYSFYSLTLPLSFTRFILTNSFYLLYPLTPFTHLLILLILLTYSFYSFTHLFLLFLLTYSRLRIGVAFRRNMSASGRQISKYMALWWQIDRLVEKSWCCWIQMFVKMNDLTSIADIFR